MIVVCRKMFFRLKGICFLKNCCTFALPNVKKGFGVVAQMVEQRTENPCVTGSIPVDATLKGMILRIIPFFYSIS